MFFNIAGFSKQIFKICWKIPVMDFFSKAAGKLLKHKSWELEKKFQNAFLTFVQLKKREKHQWRKATFSKVAR